MPVRISGNWKPFEKYFLFHFDKLNLLLANQVLLILCIFKDDIRSISQKMREESSTGRLTDMADDVFAESLKSPECIEILFNCLRNVESQTKDIYTLAHSIQDHQIKGEKQLIDHTESINFLSEKFKEYEEDRAKKDKIIEDLKSKVDSLSTKI